MSPAVRLGTHAAVAACVVSTFLQQGFAKETGAIPLETANSIPSSSDLSKTLGVKEPQEVDKIPAQEAMAEQTAKDDGSEGNEEALQKLHEKNEAEEAESQRDAFKQFWGAAAWPKKGQDMRPTKGEQDSPAMNTFQTILSGVVAFSVMGAFGGAAYYAKRRGDGSCAMEDEQEMLLGARRASQPSRILFMHLRALGTATCWRHMHPRACWMHILRIAIPGGFLYMLHKLRNFVAHQLDSQDYKTALGAMHMTPNDISNSVVDYTFTVVAFAMVMLSMVFFVRQLGVESESGLRHLLHVSGVSRSAYLLATIGVDGFAVAMFGLLFLLAFADTLLQVRLVMWTSPLLLLFMLSVLSLSTLATGYLLHLLSPSARVASLASNFLLGLLCLCVPFTIMSVTVPDPGQQAWGAFIFPSMTAYHSFFELVAGCVKGRCLSMSDVTEAIWDRKASVWEIAVGSPQAKEINDVLTPPSILLSLLVFSLLVMGLSLALVIALDTHFYPSLKQSSENVTDAAVLKVQNLVHQYGLTRGNVNPVQVLNGVSFVIRPQEVLGLLGPNGAGKTTCIRCIVGEEEPTAGVVAVNSTMATNSTYIGFCPQETVVIPDLTVAENLLFFAYVRGASSIEAFNFLENMLTASRLTEKRDWMPDTLSGGMRRRLAVSCALIGAPAVAILDEPTTGLDPLSRRGIWSTIQDNKLAGTCCLLTTHMLEEAEALCSNLVILKKGSVAANGSVQELKERWGTGYFLNVDSKAGEEDKCRDFVAACLPDCISDEDRKPIKSNNHGQMTFKLNVEEEALGRFIITIAQGKKDGGVLRWGLSQASLEDTYLQIIDSSAQDSRLADDSAEQQDVEKQEADNV